VKEKEMKEKSVLQRKDCFPEAKFEKKSKERKAEDSIMTMFTRDRETKLS
tara:strand:+ start:352 stop:501 length:150 start_codon:yes stop_codon:yes gene_type:complete